MKKYIFRVKGKIRYLQCRFKELKNVLKPPSAEKCSTDLKIEQPECLALTWGHRPVTATLDNQVVKALCDPTIAIGIYSDQTCSRLVLSYQSVTANNYSCNLGFFPQQC